MKKILLFMLIYIISINGYSQAPGVAINNSTTCDVYVVLYGDVPPSCAHSYRSTGFIIPAGGMVYYSNPADPSIPGGMTDGRGHSLTSSDVFDDVRIYQGDQTIGCMPTGHVDMGSCNALIAPITLWQNTGGSCSPCSSRTVKYTLTSASLESVTIY